MPILKLSFKKKTLENFPVRKGYSLTIGRKKNNDIIIENLAVSSYHAKIDSVGDEFVLVDLQSKNGSFVNEKIVSTHWLNDGDVINIKNIRLPLLIPMVSRSPIPILIKLKKP